MVDSFVYAVALDQEDYHLMAIRETETQIKYAGKVDEEGWLGPYKETADAALARMREMWRQAFGTKPIAWKYENERRLLINKDIDGEQPLLQSFPREAVKEIIYGERMPAGYLEQLKKVVSENYPDIPLRVARRDDDSYTLTIE